ncbi:serine/threonine-protein kinase [Stigmatella sp. ncwal1]|uniref:non-specific serine/threonine protein kinase n=1 Tax=Stigmatella ashevillensis TaxID=2995309 RepID=A0ABT5DDK5_9BACT|nr:serine/threonine-protein kinase [Stigmatella ashevillena]MDC0711764.1 serine/threonine-protein kinase [Stigmatella ashevillena]
MDTSHRMGPSALQEGMEVGPWRVMSLCGRGSYGAVYRVEKRQEPQGGAFALKVALHAWDPRFEREAELLSRVKHESVPRLEDWGEWKVRGGGVYPYVVMEWVEGEGLYEWAAQRRVSSQEVARVLGQVARALEATHAVGGVHRDVKGDNVRVRSGDGRAVLMDFGSGNYQGARPLTHQPPPPGTYEYQSPESLRFQWEGVGQRVGRYEAVPADDVYALGVTAYRVVTGRYPPEVKVEKTQEGYRVLGREWVGPEQWVELSPELGKLIQQMLSEEPSARGSAAEVAQALERMAECQELAAEQCGGASVERAVEVRSVQVAEWQSARKRVPWVAACLGGVALAVSVEWARGDRLEGEAETGSVQAKADEERDAGTVGLADAVLEAPSIGAAPGEAKQKVSLDMPKQPFPGQRRPPCEKPLATVNGGCWVRAGDVTPPCGVNYYEWRKGCYVPMFSPPRPQTSSPP